MKNIKIISVAQLTNSSKYQPIEEGIYNDLSDSGGFATYRIPVSMELEHGENTQYPLEDILDKFYLHVEIFLENDNPRTLNYVLGGELDSIQSFKSILGKRAYNEEFSDEEGTQRVKLVIE